MGAQGLKVLVVEDEAIVSMLMEDFLQDLGCEVVGPAFDLDEARALVGSKEFDAAILDVNLGGVRTYDLADELAGKGKPFAFATGYGAAGLRDQDQDRPILQKPFTIDDLSGVVTKLAAESATA